jgi:16S rRNA processing protein RimM
LLEGIFMSKLICIGQILGAHGVKGLVKLASFTDTPEDITAYGPVSDEAGKKSWSIELKGWNKTHFMANLSGITTREQAEALKGTKLYVPREKLPTASANEYYYADLIGLEVRVGGQVYGTVAGLANYGAGDILSIRKADGTSEMVIFHAQTVPEVNVAEGYLVLQPPQIEEIRG